MSEDAKSIDRERIKRTLSFLIRNEAISRSKRLMEIAETEKSMPGPPLVQLVSGEEGSKYDMIVYPASVYMPVNSLVFKGDSPDTPQRYFLVKLDSSIHPKISRVYRRDICMSSITIAHGTNIIEDPFFIGHQRLYPASMNFVDSIASLVSQLKEYRRNEFS